MFWISLFLLCLPLYAYEYTLSLTAIFQDEAPYLKEWIEYNKLIGVEHFYLYNNLSTDEYAIVLAPYVESGEVELFEWPYPSEDIKSWDLIQKAAYQDAIERSKTESKWLMVFDTDEFLVPVEKQSLLPLLKRYEKDKRIGGVCFIWSFFGTSGVYRIPEDKLLIETLVMHSGICHNGDLPTIWNLGGYKSIVRPEYVESVPSPHFCVYKDKRGHVMENFKVAHINHYWTRDQFFMETHKIPRRLLWGQDEETVRMWESEMNRTSEDNPILKFVEPLRVKMGLD